MKANHNKDYSVVKTFKAGQLAFFCLKQCNYFFLCSFHFQNQVIPNT
jgi:hypothetical protein